MERSTWRDKVILFWFFALQEKRERERSNISIMSNIYEGLQRTRETLYAAPTTCSRKDDAKIIKVWERQQKGQKRLGSR